MCKIVFCNKLHLGKKWVTYQFERRKCPFPIFKSFLKSPVFSRKCTLFILVQRRLVVVGQAHCLDWNLMQQSQMFPCVWYKSNDYIPAIIMTLSYSSSHQPVQASQGKSTKGEKAIVYRSHLGRFHYYWSLQFLNTATWRPWKPARSCSHSTLLETRLHLVKIHHFNAKVLQILQDILIFYIMHYFHNLQ